MNAPNHNEPDTLETRPPVVSNEEIAAILDQVASKLQAQQANQYRVEAYRKGAAVIRERADSVQGLALTDGRAALDALPRIGPSLAACIDEIAHTGRLRLLERLNGHVTPVDVFLTVPGIGEHLSARLHRDLHIDTLEELELAAHDGRLARVAGFGPRRLQAIQDILATRLARSSRSHNRKFQELVEAGASVNTPRSAPKHPPVGLILEIDRCYRMQAQKNALPRITPRRNNAEGKRWLPVLHVDREGWHFTVMFSNTERAHRMGQTWNWVVVYYERDGHESRCVVVTEYRGALDGKRVVRGRERACIDYYREQ